MELDGYQYAQLTSLAECHIHTHPRHILSQNDAADLEAASPVKVVTANYVLRADDEQIAVNGTPITITLPKCANGKEYHITLISASSTLTVVPTGTNTVMGTTSLVATIRWTSLHFKATTTGNWILL